MKDHKPNESRIVSMHSSLSRARIHSVKQQLKPCIGVYAGEQGLVVCFDFWIAGVCALEGRSNSTLLHVQMSTILESSNIMSYRL
eukprot:m.141808 g.141808  ORF g.141808 m.141808 type:complete len:85 (+) comp14043_c0_seq2:771-1025(+)